MLLYAAFVADSRDGGLWQVALVSTGPFSARTLLGNNPTPYPHTPGADVRTHSCCCWCVMLSLYVDRSQARHFLWWL